MPRDKKYRNFLLTDTDGFEWAWTNTGSYTLSEIVAHANKCNKEWQTGITIVSAIPVKIDYTETPNRIVR